MRRKQSGASQWRIINPGMYPASYPPLKCGASAHFECSLVSILHSEVLPALFSSLFPERVMTLLLHSEWLLNSCWWRGYCNKALWYQEAPLVTHSRWDCTSNTASVTDCVAVGGASTLFGKCLLDWVSQGTAVLLWLVFGLLIGLIFQSRTVMDIHTDHTRAPANSMSERQVSHKWRH